MSYKKELEGKYKKLRTSLTGLGSAVLAFSGGLDSGLLAKVAFDCLGARLIAVTAQSPTYPPQDARHARKIAQGIGIKHLIIKTNEFKDKNFLKNSKKRCYFCKRELFSKMQHLRRKYRFKNIIDGTNYSDRYDERPGLAANKEFGVRSPLYECGFSKKDVSSLAKALGLSFWDKPSGTCLSSRIPFGQIITKAKLDKVRCAEEALRGALGAKVLLRARDHNEIVRIEIAKSHWTKLKNSDINKIINKLKNLGYKYVTLDLEGYIPAGLR
ncbi:MAG: ATP-dependent sacrificial sulfur transferase LarE [Candidatus Omnitrophica bacterium]|nr:ATP-dependent sacrificial sulfur transferase LarE [Candidatus Omnitrophota bacterium]